MGIIGLTTMSLGLFAIAFLPADASVPDIAWRLALAGIGTGIFQSPNNKVMLSSVPMHRSGGAGGMLATARTIGQAIGSALVAVLFVRLPGDVHFAAPLLGGIMALFGAGVSALRLRHS
jgi:DHA2 family multidrug resistance protein-like MFS transporter